MIKIIRTPTTNKNIALAKKHHFEWKYILKMETKKGDVKMYYMLKNNADYFGIAPVVLDEVNTKQCYYIGGIAQ